MAMVLVSLRLKARFALTLTLLVDGSVPVICMPASGSTFPVGTTTVSCTATDHAGNKAAASFAVSVAAPVVKQESPAMPQAQPAVANDAAPKPEVHDKKIVKAFRRLLHMPKKDAQPDSLKQP